MVLQQPILKLPAVQQLSVCMSSFLISISGLLLLFRLYTGSYLKLNIYVSCSYVVSVTL